MDNEYQIQEPKRALKNIAYLAAAFVLVTALVAVVYYLTKVNKPATSSSHEVGFVIEKGLRTRTVADKLEDQKIISNSNIFLIYSYLNSAGSKIQAGEYSLDSNMTIPEIIDILTHGKVVRSDRNLTIIEGWRNTQVARFLTQRQIISADAEFQTALQNNEYNFKFASLGKEFNYQGFLFPDTYKLAKDETVVELINKMLANFENKVTDQMVTDSGNNLKQALIVASIVEKEVGRNKEKLTDEDLRLMQRERELVASVFYNRLEIGMALESDATVNYVTGKFDRSATIADTKIKSPYNTYQIKGLPPTPISNPGLNAIKASIYPAKSDYLFFLNAPDGTAYFGKTLAEHNENRAKYLR
jgi:UPF0755 protein